MVGLTALGFCFCWWARLHMGKLWSASITRKEDYRVVDSGPYPSIPGSPWRASPAPWCGARWCRWAGALLLLLAWYIKARLEERFLRAELGAKTYDAYPARVPMLVPFLKL